MTDTARPQTVSSHTLCCDPNTGICGSEVTDASLGNPGLPRCNACTELDAANVPCSLDCPFATTTPLALEDYQ